MKRRKIALGPGASSLILIIMTLSMSILCMLTFLSAKNALALSRRSAEMIQQVYALNDSSERSLAALDELLVRCAAQAADDAAYQSLVRQQLPEGMTMEEGCVAWVELQGERGLSCMAELSPLGEEPRLRWKQHSLTVETEDTWN